MSGVLSRSRVSSEQLDLLVTFMEEHPEFAAGKLSIYSRFSSSKLWRLLAERLNAAAHPSGGALKSPDKWCRYWADIKYKARKKTASGGALGELSTVDERLQNIINNTLRESEAAARARRASHSDEDRKPTVDDMCPETAGGAGAGTGTGSGSGAATDEGSTPSPHLATEELLAEAAMRSALAAEKQAEAVVQAVDLLRELVSLLRERGTMAAVPPGEYHHHHRL